uniref:Uncharacterized protein n=1 Tax=Cucumis melo TaxID=3656 RepID=A0A9I9E2G7_CUCME
MLKTTPWTSMLVTYGVTLCHNHDLLNTGPMIVRHLFYSINRSAMQNPKIVDKLVSVGNKKSKARDNDDSLRMFDNPSSMGPFVDWFMWSVLGDPLLKLIAVDWFKVDKSFDGIALHPRNLIKGKINTRGKSKEGKSKKNLQSPKTLSTSADWNIVSALSSSIRRTDQLCFFFFFKNLDLHSFAPSLTALVIVVGDEIL